MRSSDLASLIQLNNFPTGRRLRAFTVVHSLVAGMAFDDLSTLLSEAIAHDEETQVLEQRWRVKRKSGKISKKQARAQKQLQQIDIRTDNTLSALRDGAEAVIHGADPELDKELIHTVDLFLDEVLPGGVQAVSGRRYPEELLAVEAIVKKLQSDTLKPVVNQLGLTLHAERLAKLAPLYRAALDAAGETLEFGVLRAARSKGQDYLLQAVLVISAKYRLSEDESARMRAKLLRPILEQDDAISAHYRARRSVPDVNPETGEEQPAEVDVEETESGEDGGAE